METVSRITHPDPDQILDPGILNIARYRKN